MMDEVHSYIDVTSSTFPFLQRDFYLNEMVFNFALPVGHNLNYEFNGVPFAQVIFN